MSVQWRFPSNDFGENKGINDSGVALFRGTPLKSLAREICQNSMDAAQTGSARVDFEMSFIKTNTIPGIDSLHDAFERSLDFWSVQKYSKTKDFFTRAIKVSEADECCVLRISDYDTVGLTGSKEEINTNWTNLTKSAGASDKKGTAGGSYGIGKYAPFACSDFSTVFYSTNDINGDCAYQGVSRIVTFRTADGNTTQGIGYYGNEKNTPVYEQLSLVPGFSRPESEFGTDIYIVAFKYADDWKTDVIVSVLDSFLGAIWNEKLVVNVAGVELSKAELPKLIDQYKDELVSHTEQYYNVLVSQDTIWSEEDFLGKGKIRLGLLFGDEDAPKRVAMIRKTGMKIKEQDHIGGFVPFVGVLFIEGDRINEELRLIENPEHTKWEPDRSPNPIAAKAVLKALRDYIKDKVDELSRIGENDAVDAAGIGQFLPDEGADSLPGKQKNEETFADGITEIQQRKATSITLSGRASGSSETRDSDRSDGEAYSGDGDEGYPHPGGNTDTKSPKDPSSVEYKKDGEHNYPQKSNVSLDKFVPICVNKQKGKYVFSLTPSCDCENAIAEIFLSAETQTYEAPIIKAAMIGGGELIVDNNKLEGFSLKKGTPIRVAVDIDYYDYCAIEVKCYATKE